MGRRLIGLIAHAHCPALTQEKGMSTANIWLQKQILLPKTVKTPPNRSPPCPCPLPFGVVEFEEFDDG